MIDPRAAAFEIEQRVQARAETVFTYFTDPEKYRRWQGTRAEFDPRPGGRFRVEFGPGGVAVGEFVAVDPPRRLVFTWGWMVGPAAPQGIREVVPGSTTVEVLLESQGEETIVRLRHSDLPSEDATLIHRATWPRYLERLAQAAAGADPGLDPVASLAAEMKGLSAERGPRVPPEEHATR